MLAAGDHASRLTRVLVAGATVIRFSPLRVRSVG